MQLDLSEEQSLFLTSLDRLLTKYRHVPADQPDYVRYSGELQKELAESGFLNISSEDGYGPLDAALLVESIARLPWSVEVAGSALVLPALGGKGEGPLALCEGIGHPTRYLAQARQVCLQTSDGFRLADLDDAEIEPVKSVVAYPLGILHAVPKRSVLLDAKTADAVRTLWRIAITAEAAGLMRGALDLTVAYVKDRRQFKQALGDFQAVQHRLAVDEQLVSGSFFLAMRAAYSLRPEDAAVAAAYVQQHMRTIIYDCHQFTGAMGVTLEYPLHLWTYRLKYLQGELGGRSAQTLALADIVWPRRDSVASPET